MHKYRCACTYVPIFNQNQVLNDGHFSSNEGLDSLENHKTTPIWESQCSPMNSLGLFIFGWHTNWVCPGTAQSWRGDPKLPAFWGLTHPYLCGESSGLKTHYWIELYELSADSYSIDTGDVPLKTRLTNHNSGSLFLF